MRVPHAHGIVVAALAAGLGAGCAHAHTDAFELAFDSGRIEEAARIFDGDSALWRDEKAFFRTATARAMPGSPIYDPAHAHAELQTFLTRFPQSEHRGEALRLDALLVDLERLTTQNRSLSLRADSLADRLDSLSARSDSANARLAEQRRFSLQLQADLRRTEAELKSVQDELQRLKAIDLRLSRRKR